MEAIHRCKFNLEAFVFFGHMPIFFNGTIAGTIKPLPNCFQTGIGTESTLSLKRLSW